MALFNYKKAHIDWFVCLLFLFAIVLWRTSLSKLTLYVAIPVIIIHEFLRGGKKITRSPYWTLYLLMIIWMLMSSFVSTNIAKSFSMMVPIVAAFLFSFATYSMCTRANNSKAVYIAYIIFFLVLLGLTVLGEGFTADFDYENEIERRENTEMNSNQYAYFSLFMIYAIRLLILDHDSKFNRYVRMVLYLVLSGLVLFTALMTASRQIMFLELPLIALFVFYDYTYQKKTGNILFFIIIAIVAAIIALPYMIEIIQRSYLAQRVQESLGEDSRVFLLQDGIRNGMKSPIFGVGLGAPVKFSHCTFVHLFSRCGIVAALLYVWIIARFIITQFERYRVCKNHAFLILSICGCFFFIGNMFYSYISEPFMMAILFAMIGDAERRYQEVKLN